MRRLIPVLLFLPAIIAITSLACGGSTPTEPQSITQPATPRTQADATVTPSSAAGADLKEPVGQETAPQTPDQSSISQGNATVINKANLRAGPGTDHAVVGAVEQGDTIELVASNDAGDWYQLASGAWIAAFLVDNAPDGLSAVDGGAAQPQPAEETPVPSAAPSARPVGIGTHIVGDAIQPGIYSGLAGEGLLGSCYWERLMDLTGEMPSILANDNAVGPFYVEVRSTHFALKTACQLTPLAQALVVSVVDMPGSGTYLVGRNIQPGTYKGEAGSDILNACYWERLRDVAGDAGSIIANDNAMGSFFVQVLSTDFALKTNCSLVRVGD